jgi:hypothetical protein
MSREVGYRPHFSRDLSLHRWIIHEIADADKNFVGFVKILLDILDY